MSKKLKIVLVVVSLIGLYFIASFTMPIWLTWIGKTIAPDMNLPSESQLAGMYKPKNLLPMYGYGEKTPEQKKADEEFINSVVKEVGSREKGSIGIAGGARQWLEKGDLDTAMKRYNQAWLLDDTNPEVYKGFGDILIKQGYAEDAEKMYEKGRILAIQKYKDARLSAAIIGIGLALDDWYAINKENYLGFIENKSNVDKINGMMAEIKNEGKIEVEYNIYTVSQDYVVKLRAKGDSSFYCTNFDILSEKAKTPDVPFQPIAASGDNFMSKVNCDGGPM